MARPQKFRHSVEALSDPQVAEKLGRFVIDIETLRTKRKQIDDQIAAAYDAVDDGGFEKKFVRKVVALRAKEEGARHEEEANLEAYEIAVEKGVSLACARRNGNASYSEAKGRGDAVGKTDAIPFDPETGELTDNQKSEPCLGHATEHSAYVGTAPDENPAQDDVGATASSTYSHSQQPPAPADMVEASTEKQAAGTSRPTHSNSQASSVPADTAGEAPSSSQASPAANSSSATSAGADGHPGKPSDDARAAEPGAAAPHRSAQSSQAVTSSDDDIPAFIKQDKPDCLKLKDGHCRLSFATSALCAECNQRRTMARALA